jgi:hypothetical protein
MQHVLPPAVCQKPVNPHALCRVATRAAKSADAPASVTESVAPQSDAPITTLAQLRAQVRAPKTEEPKLPVREAAEDAQVNAVKARVLRQMEAEAKQKPAAPKPITEAAASNVQTKPIANSGNKLFAVLCRLPR